MISEAEQNFCIPKGLNNNWQEADMTINKCPLLYLITTTGKWIGAHRSIKLNYSQTGVALRSHYSSPDLCEKPHILDLFQHLISVYTRTAYTSIPPVGSCVTIKSMMWLFFIYRRDQKVITVLCSHTGLPCNDIEPEVLFYSTES